MSPKNVFAMADLGGVGEVSEPFEHFLFLTWESMGELLGGVVSPVEGRDLQLPERIAPGAIPGPLPYIPPAGRAKIAYVKKCPILHPRPKLHM